MCDVGLARALGEPRSRFRVRGCCCGDPLPVSVGGGGGCKYTVVFGLFNDESSLSVCVSVLAVRANRVCSCECVSGMC